MNDDNLVSFELPEPSTTAATHATDHLHVQASLAARLDHVTGLMRDVALLLAREDVTTRELTLIDQIVTRMETLLYHNPQD